MRICLLFATIDRLWICQCQKKWTCGCLTLEKLNLSKFITLHNFLIGGLIVFLCVWCEKNK